MGIVSTLIGQTSPPTSLWWVTARADTLGLTLIQDYPVLSHLCQPAAEGGGEVPDVDEELPVVPVGQLALQIQISNLLPADQRLPREHDACLWGAVGKLGKEAAAKEGGEHGGDKDVDEGEHDAGRAVGFRVAASIADGLGGLKGKEDCGHQAVQPGEAPVRELLLVVLLELVKGDASEDEVDDEDRRPHEDEAEPVHLQDLVHACVARHSVVEGDADVDDDDTHGRSAWAPSTWRGRTR